MAKQRMINTRFWSDGFVRKLTLEEKLFYLYLLTNEHTDICGVYEIGLDTMSFESGLSIDRISKTIHSLWAKRKVLFSDGWIYIKNWKKYQLDNPKVNQGIKLGLEKVPRAFLDQIAVFDSLSIDYDSLSHSNPNPNSNPNSNSNLHSPNGEEVETSGSEKKVKKVKREKTASYGNEEINLMLESFKKLFGLTDFKDSKEWQRIYGNHLVNLSKSLGEVEFMRRVTVISRDLFKLKNCNSLKFLYAEIKSTPDPAKAIVSQQQGIPRF